MKKIIITFSIVFLFVGTGFAQSNLFGVGWEINIPNNNNFLSKTSYAGGKLEYRHFIKKNLSVGVAVNWAYYDQYLPRQTFQKPDGNGAVTGDFVAQVFQLPLTATVHYYFHPGKTIKPYVGVGLGGQYMGQSLYYNVYVSEDNNWGFVARPELGAIIKPAKFDSWGILLAANYSYSTNKTALINSDSFQNIGFTIGVVFGQ